MNNQTDPGPIRGQFSSSLKVRSVWKVIGPVLTTQAASLHESHLPGCDFNLSLGNSSQPLRVLLLTPSSLIPENKDQTLSQLSDFSTSILSSPGRYLIALLLSEEPFNSATGKYSLSPLLALQILIVESDLSPIPILPIPDSSSFLASIQEYMGNLGDIPAQDPSTADSINLLAHTSSGDAGFLSEHDINIMSDMFPSLKVMSQALQTQDGQDILCDYLGEEKARDVIDFWGDAT